MKKTIINPPSTFPPYLHYRSLAVSHHRFLPPSLPPLAPSVPPTFYSPSPLPCLTSSLPPSLPPLAPSVPPTFYSPSPLPCLTSSLPPSLPPLAPSVPPTFYSPSPLPCLTSSLPPSLPPAPCSLRPSDLLFSLAPSLSHIIASSLPPSHPLLPPSLYSPSLLPCPSLPACLLPCNSIYTVCVYSVGELHWVLCREGPGRRRYAARRGIETMEWSRHHQVARCYLGNAPLRRIRFWRIVKKIRRSKRATNTHKHGRGSYLSDGTRGESQSHVERKPLRSKDRGLFTYNIQ